MKLFMEKIQSELIAGSFAEEFLKASIKLAKNLSR